MSKHSRPRTSRSKRGIRIQASESPECDVEAARTLLRFAEHELSEMGGRIDARSVQETLLWVAFGYNRGMEPEPLRDEILATARSRFGAEFAAWLHELFERRRLRFADEDVKIGALRVEPGGPGELLLHVDPPPK